MLDNIPILSLLVFSPIVGILALLFIRSENGRLLRIVATAGPALPLLVHVGASIRSVVESARRAPSGAGRSPTACLRRSPVSGSGRVRALGVVGLSAVACGRGHRNGRGCTKG